MTRYGSASLRLFVAALLMIFAGACTGSSESDPTSSTSTTTSSTTSVSPAADGVTFGPFGASPAVRVAAALPDGWSDDSDFGALSGPDEPNPVGVLFFSADSLYSDPCHWDVAGTGVNEVGDVEFGPGAEDLVAAVGENTFYTSTDPTPVTIDGYSGQQIEIQLPDDTLRNCDEDGADGDRAAYLFPISVYVQGPSHIWDLTVLDVDGTRLVAAVLSYPGSSQADLDTARNVIETMEIQG
jgi:hypothetical protein